MGIEAGTKEGWLFGWRVLQVRLSINMTAGRVKGFESLSAIHRVATGYGNFGLVRRREVADNLACRSNPTAVSFQLQACPPMSAEPLIAVFIDFENLAIGVRDMKTGDFEMRLVLKRLLEKGRIVFKRAYCDWRGYASAVRDFHSQGIELIDIPQSKMSGKNSADIRMVVDAMDLCYSKNHIDAFALISGDSDFSPLVSKLKENNKRVIGCGVKSSTSDLLIANCDEFLYYDDLIRAAKKRQPAPRKGKAKPDKKQEASDQLVEVLQSLEQDYDPVWGSMLKQAVRRVYPGFNETYYGFSSFSELLQDIAKQGRIELEYDANRGNYKIRRKE